MVEGNERTDALARNDPQIASPKPFCGVVIATVKNRIKELLNL